MQRKVVELTIMGLSMAVLRTVDVAALAGILNCTNSLGAIPTFVEVSLNKTISFFYFVGEKSRYHIVAFELNLPVLLCYLFSPLLLHLLQSITVRELSIFLVSIKPLYAFKYQLAVQV